MEDYHLHQFEVGPRVYSVPDPDAGGQVLSEQSVTLNRIAGRVGDSFVYSYDFGDGWQHDVLLEATLLPEPEVLYPRCLEGARNGRINASLKRTLYGRPAAKRATPKR